MFICLENTMTKNHFIIRITAVHLSIKRIKYTKRIHITDYD